MGKMQKNDMGMKTLNEYPAQAYSPRLAGSICSHVSLYTN